MQPIQRVLMNMTVWKVSKYGVISGPYFPVFGLNTERYSVSLRIQPECVTIRTRINSVFGHFSRSASTTILPIEKTNGWILKQSPEVLYKKNFSMKLKLTHKQTSMSEYQSINLQVVCSLNKLSLTKNLRFWKTCCTLVQ